MYTDEFRECYTTQYVAVRYPAWLDSACGVSLAHDSLPTHGHRYTGYTHLH